MIGKESTGSGTSLLLLMKHLYMFHWYDTGEFSTSFVSISNKSTSFIHQESTRYNVYVVPWYMNLSFRGFRMNQSFNNQVKTNENVNYSV